MRILIFLETPNDGGGDGNDTSPMNGESDVACIVQDHEMEGGKIETRNKNYSRSIYKKL